MPAWRPWAPRRSSRNPGVTSVGIGVPGLYDPAAGTTRFLVNIPGAWAGRPVAGPVGDGAGLPAALINDARAFGLAELRLGAGRGASSMVGLTLGTGVGGVIAIDGRVHQGHDGTAGELGHQTLEPDGPSCGCGNRGCLEAFARADRIAAACGTATAEEAMAAARAGDAAAVAGLRAVGRYLGIGIANMIVVITPDVVVIGGGICGGRRPAARPDRGRAARRVYDDLARSRSSSCRPSSGRGPGPSARPSMARRRPSETIRPRPTSRPARGDPGQRRAAAPATARSSRPCASGSRPCGRAPACRPTRSCARSSASAG